MNHIEVSDSFRILLADLENVSDALPELCEGCPEMPKSISELFRIKDDGFLAVMTGDLVITLEPTERLSELVTAARAWKRIHGVPEKTGEIR